MSAHPPDEHAAALAAKLREPPPIELTADEEALLIDALRQAVAETLQIAPDAVPDDARIFDELGLDSIDVFDALDQLAARFDVAMEVESLPVELLRGTAGMTFREFAATLVGHFSGARAGAAPGGDAVDGG